MNMQPRIPTLWLLSMLPPLLIAASCVNVHRVDASQPELAQRPCGEKGFLVRISDQEGPPLDDVQISTVSSGGIQPLVKTSLGESYTCLDYSVLQDPKVFCILFCRDGYHCGALVPKKDLLQYWELKIALARIMI